jgi:phosphoglycerate dehydrogenase-like enzyme
MSSTDAIDRRASGLHESLRARIDAGTARVGIIGLGYVGLPLAQAFTGGGFPVLSSTPTRPRSGASAAARATSATSPTR